MKISACLLLFFLFIEFTYAQIADKYQIGKNADTYLSRAEPFGFSGAVLIAVGEEVILNKGYGYAVPADKTRNTSETVFSLGSIVKPFTATLIMKLVQEDKLSIDDPLSKFFAATPEKKKDITIHHLLSHSSGLPGAIGLDTQHISKTEYLKNTWQQPLEFEPGTRYRYSNVGYTLLALIIERVTGLTYENYLNETILEPAGMSKTGYTLPRWESERLAHNISQGIDHGAFPDREHFPTWHLIGNGGMLSTTGDMYRFYRFMKSDQLLSDKTKELMWTPVFMEDALGWVNINNGEVLQYNGGSMDGNGAIMKWYPQDDVFLMVFTNQTIEGKLGFMLVEQSLQNIIFNQNMIMPPKIEVDEDADWKNIIGMYELDQKQVFQFLETGQELFLQPKSQQAFNILNGMDSESPYLTEQWNEKIDQIIGKAVEMKDFSALQEISRNPERLRDMILDELEMEGYTQPKVKTLYSQKVDEGLIKTLVAISDQDFEGESMLFHLLFQNGFNAGFGVDFGSDEMPLMRLISTNKNTFVAFDFVTGNSFKLQMRSTDDQNNYIMKTANKSFALHRIM